MIGHQAATEQDDARVAQILARQAQVRFAVLISGEGRATVHAALCDVAGNPRQHTSISSGHAV
jgi:hypothetical protein